MDELGAGERRLLDALRDADEPTDDDRRRMRAAVWARLGLAGTAATAAAASTTIAAEAGAAGSASAAAAAPAVGSSAAASMAANASTAVAKGAAFTLLGAPVKIGLATLIVGLATGAALSLSTSGGAPEAPRAVEAARIVDPAPRTPHAGASSDGAPPAAEASDPARDGASAEASDPARDGASAGTIDPAEPSATPAAASAKRAPASRPAPPAAAAAARPGGGGLDAEIALLRDAQQALQAGQFAQALSKLNEHASRYPRGVLSTEREASRAIALCRSGSAASGRAIAAKLLAQSPGSPLATRVRAACGQEE
ncbi:hypothetical protein SOCE26_017250 [Sorangium cellulosum]|uniref:Uncharacterized protein n=1 Tax=Sorangium cellulosum TaxID=56 RepID=A0A2L0EM08_SORCE|nr:hypothetical protein [Sorangium cellulosum]AUX40325.1 hypothetical protein SOCE26_017250 [Sorangium cellulosum]